MLSDISLSVLMLMLSVLNAESPYAECHYAE
jgi:hypothetical protein